MSRLPRWKRSPTARPRLTWGMRTALPVCALISRKVPLLLVLKYKLGFLIGDAGLGVVDLRVDVAVDENEVLPAGVVEVDEGVAPADVGDRWVVRCRRSERRR